MIAIALVLALPLLSSRRRVLAATEYALYLLWQVVWTFGNAAKILSVGLEAKVFWDDLAWVGTLCAPAALLLFALRFADKRASLRRILSWGGYLLGALFLIPILLKYPLSGASSTYRLLIRSGVVVLDYPLSGAFLGASIYAYALILAAIYTLLRLMGRVKGVFRRQVLLILAGGLIPMAFSVLAFFDITLFGERDLTPYTFTVGNLLTVYGLLRMRLFRLSPLARDLVIEGMRDPLIVTDSDGRILDFNPAARELLGLDEQKSHGARISLVAPALAEVPADRPEPYRISLGGEGGANRVFEATRTALAGDGRRVGQSSIFVLRDMTERARMELDLARVQRQVADAEKRAALVQLVSSVSHQVNTPIAAVASSSETIIESVQALVASLAEQGATRELGLLARDILSAARDTGQRPSGVEGARKRRELREILEKAAVLDAAALAASAFDLSPTVATERIAAAATDPDPAMRGLFRLVLGLAEILRAATVSSLAVDKVARVIFALRRLSTAGGIGTLQLVSLPEMLDQAVKKLRGERPALARLTVEYADMEVILCWPDELAQVWPHLLENADEAAGPEGKLSLKAHWEGDRAVVEIRDDGPGIPEELMEKVFEPFFTTKEKGGGAGLGLAISRDIIERHGGRLLYRRESEGTLFRAELPREPPYRERIDKSE